MTSIGNNWRVMAPFARFGEVYPIWPRSPIIGAVLRDMGGFFASLANSESPEATYRYLARFGDIYQRSDIRCDPARPDRIRRAVARFGNEWRDFAPAEEIWRYFATSGKIWRGFAIYGVNFDNFRVFG